MKKLQVLQVSVLLWIPAILSGQNCSVNAGPDTSFCAGGSVVLTSTGMPNAVWSPSAGLSCTACPSPVASPVVTTTYVVTATQNVSAAVNGDFSQGATGFTSAYVLNNTSVYTEGEYAITTNANFVHSGFGSFGDHTTGTGNYMVVNGSSVPGTDVWCQTVTIPPNTNFTFSCWVLNLCNPQASLQFSINGVPQNLFTIPATIGVWTQFSTVWNSGANTTVTICIENMNTLLAGNDFGLDDIEFTYVCSDTDSVVVTVDPLPSVNFSITDNSGCDTVCPQWTDLSTVAAPATITQWSWDLGDGNISNSPLPSHCYNTPGLYDVTLTATTDQGCSATLTLNDTILVVSPPSAAFTANHWMSTTLDPYFLFTDNSSNATSWSWTFGDAASGTSSLQNPSYTYSSPGSYDVCLEVTGLFGCSDSVCGEVIVQDEWTLYVPNTFTPNGDGNNDLFLAQGENVVSFHMMIFNRWGEMIFETNDALAGWNGKPAGSSSMAQEDVYVYKIEAVGNTGTRRHIIGHVNLIR